jgi:hypothetical protein
MTSEEEWEQQFIEWRAAVLEGFCPLHKTQLITWGRPGYCLGCASWWYYEHDKELVTRHFCQPQLCAMPAYWNCWCEIRSPEVTRQ